MTQGYLWLGDQTPGGLFGVSNPERPSLEMELECGICRPGNELMKAVILNNEYMLIQWEQEIHAHPVGIKAEHSRVKTQFVQFLKTRVSRETLNDHLKFPASQGGLPEDPRPCRLAICPH